MSALMDMLADASVAAATHESEAASILQNLFCARRGSPEASTSDADHTYLGDMEVGMPPRAWAHEEDDLIHRMVSARAGSISRGGKAGAAQQLEACEWRQITGQLEGRSAPQCAHRFQKVVNPDNVKGDATRSKIRSSLYYQQHAVALARIHA